MLPDVKIQVARLQVARLQRPPCHSAILPHFHHYHLANSASVERQTIDKSITDSRFGC